jgi:hypothetical protein
MISVEGWVERKDKRIEFFNNNRKVISAMVQKAHRVNLMPEAITLASNHDIFGGSFFSDAVFNSCAYIAKVSKDELAFYRTIYKHSQHSNNKCSSPLKIETTMKNEYFRQYCDRVLAVFSTFYEEVNIVWITSGEIEGDVTSFFSKFVTPSYKINDNYLKFVGERPRYKKFDNVPDFLNINEFNFMNNDSDYFMNTFFDRFNTRIIPDEPDLKLNKDMDLQTLKDRLTLISMVMI